MWRLSAVHAIGRARNRAVHATGLLHKAERRYENKSSRISERWETSVFVVPMKRPKGGWGGGGMMKADNGPSHVHLHVTEYARKSCANPAHP